MVCSCSAPDVSLAGCIHRVSLHIPQLFKHLFVENGSSLTVLSQILSKSSCRFIRSVGGPAIFWFLALEPRFAFQYLRWHTIICKCACAVFRRPKPSKRDKIEKERKSEENRDVRKKRDATHGFRSLLAYSEIYHRHS